MVDGNRDRYYDGHDEDQTQGPVFPGPDLASQALTPAPPGEWSNLPEEPREPGLLDKIVGHVVQNLVGMGAGLVPMSARPQEGDVPPPPGRELQAPLDYMAAASQVPNQLSKGFQAEVGPDGGLATADRYRQRLAKHWQDVMDEQPGLSLPAALSAALERGKRDYEQRYDEPLANADPTGGQIAGIVNAAHDVGTNPLVMRSGMDPAAIGGATMLGTLGEAYNDLGPGQNESPTERAKNIGTAASIGTGSAGVYHILNDLKEHGPEAVRAVQESLRNLPSFRQALAKVEPDLARALYADAVPGELDNADVLGHPGLMKALGSNAPDILATVARQLGPHTAAGADRWATLADTTSAIPAAAQKLNIPDVPDPGELAPNVSTVVKDVNRAAPVVAQGSQSLLETLGSRLPTSRPAGPPTWDEMNREEHRHAGGLGYGHRLSPDVAQARQAGSFRSENDPHAPVPYAGAAAAPLTPGHFTAPVYQAVQDLLNGLGADRRPPDGPPTWDEMTPQQRLQAGGLGHGAQVNPDERAAQLAGSFRSQSGPGGAPAAVPPESTTAAAQAMVQDVLARLGLRPPARPDRRDVPFRAPQYQE